MGYRAKNRIGFLGLCGLVLVFAQGCEELPKLQGFYFELEPVFETYHVDTDCNPTTLFDDWPTGQPPQVAPFGASVTQAGDSIGGMFLPPYPILPAFNVHGLNHGGVVSVHVYEDDALKLFDMGFMTGYSIVFNGTAVDQTGDNVADVIVLDTNRDNYALAYGPSGECVAYVDTNSSQNYLSNDHGVDEIVTAYVGSLQHMNIVFGFDGGPQCVYILAGWLGACLQPPLDILIHINWDTFQMVGEDLEQGVTFSLSHDPVEPNIVMFGKWDGPEHDMLNEGRITADFGIGTSTEYFRGSVMLDVGGTLVLQNGRLRVSNVWIDLLDPHIDIENFFDEVEDWAFDIFALFQDDVEDELSDAVEEAINTLFEAL
jgi:hypothetical protein